jgi:hypothetical protein
MAKTKQTKVQSVTPHANDVDKIDTDSSILREVTRKRIKNLLSYAHMHHKTEQVCLLQRKLEQLPIGGIRPDELRPMVGHCGHFRVIDNIPFTTPCCGAVLFVLTGDNTTESVFDT